MKLVRRIVSTSLISSLVFIILFATTIALTSFMLRLKELSFQTIKVMSDWNALDRITNDVLYYRLDSLSRLSSLEQSWLKAGKDLEESFRTLKDNRLLNVLPEDISISFDEAWYYWLFSNRKLVSGQQIFNEIISSSTEGGRSLIEIDKTTFHEKLVYMIEQEDSYEEGYIYRNFMAHMYVLDITGERFSLLLETINEEIPHEIDDYIYSLLLAVGGILVLMILLTLFNVRKMTVPIIQMARAVHDMSEEEYPVNLNPPDRVDQDDEIAVIQAGFNRMAVRIHALYDESLNKEKEKRRAQFRALQYQINPHFLYNTLGALRMKASLQGDSEMADHLQALSRLLRSTISKSDSFIHLSDEIEIMKDYLAIIQIRYKNRISTGFIIDPETEDLYVPALILQPLLENAVLHGLSARLNRSDDAVLEVRCSSGTEELRLSVYDNGCGMDHETASSLFTGTKDEGQDGSAHIGLVNIRDRLQLLFGSKTGIEVDTAPNKGTEVTLTLPFLKDIQDAETFTG